MATVRTVRTRIEFDVRSAEAAAEGMQDRMTQLNLQMKNYRESLERMKEKDNAEGIEYFNKQLERTASELQAVQERYTVLERGIERARKGETAFQRVDSEGTGGMNVSELNTARRNADAIKRGIRSTDENAVEDMEKAVEVSEKAQRAAASLKYGFLDALADVKEGVDGVGVPALKRYEAALLEMQKHASNDADFQELTQALGRVRLAIQESAEDYAEGLTSIKEYSTEKITASIAELEKLRQSETLMGEDADRLATRLAELKEELTSRALQIGEQLDKGTFTGTIADLERAKKALTEYRKTIAQTAKGSEELKKVDAAIGNIDEQIKGCHLTTQKFAEILTEPKGKSFDELKAAVERAEKQLHAMPRATEEERAAFEQLKGQIEAAKEEMKDFGDAQEDTSLGMDGLKEKAKQLAAAYLGLQAFKEVWGSNVEMSDAMADVRKTTGMTAEEVDNLTRSIKDIDTRAANEQLMALAATAGQVGLSTHEQVYGFVAAANQITTSLDELGTDGVLQLMKVAQVSGALDEELGDVETALLKVGSSINELSAASSATAGPITDFIGRVGGVASTAHIAMADIAALGATTDQLAISSELAGTQMNLFINGMQRHTDIVATTIGESREWVEQMIEQGRTMEVLVSLLEKMRGMNAVELYDFLKDMGSSGGRATQVFATLSQNVEALRANIITSNQAYREGISITNEYNTRNESAAGLVARLKNELQETFVRPEIINAIRAMASAAKTFLEVWMNPYMAPAMNAITVFLASSLLGVNKLSVAVRNLRMKIAEAGSTTKGFAVVWKSLWSANWPAIILAIGAAIGTMLVEMYTKFKKTRQEIGEMTNAINEQRKAVDKLFKPLKDTNTALDERKRLVDQINSQYGHYLGYMLNETTSARQLAEAHRQVVLQLKEEALQKKILDKQKEVTTEHEEELNARYGAMVTKGAGSVRSGHAVEDVMDEIKAFIDKNADKFTGFDLATTITKSEGGKMLDGFLKELVKQGKLDAKGLNTIKVYASDYAREMYDTQREIQKETQIYESDLRSTQRNIRLQTEESLETLISNISNFAENEAKKYQTGKGPLAPQPQAPSPSTTQQLQQSWQKGTDKDKGNTWSKQPSATPPNTPAFVPDIEHMTQEQARQFISYQDQLRSYVETNSERLTETQREEAKRVIITEKQMQAVREKAGLPATDGGDAVPTAASTADLAIDKQSTEHLKKRKKDLQKMADLLEDGFDVTLLHYDKEFQKTGIETVDAAREWFNDQMQQIQAVLDARRKAAKPDKTKDPDKAEAKSERERRRMNKDQIRGAVSAIDAEAADAEERIKEQRAAGVFGDGEMNRRLEQAQMEHYERLRQMYRLFLGDIGEMSEKQQVDILTTIGIDDESVEDTRARVAEITAWLKSRGTDIQQNLTLKAKVAGAKVQDILVKHNERIKKALESDHDNVEKSVEAFGETLDKLDLIFNLSADADTSPELLKRRLNSLIQYAQNAHAMTAEQLKALMEEEAAFSGWEKDRADEDYEVLLQKLQNYLDERTEAIKKDAQRRKKLNDFSWKNSEVGQTMAGTVETTGSVVEQVKSAKTAGKASDQDVRRAEVKAIEAQILAKRTYIDVTRAQMAVELARMKQALELAKKDEELALAERARYKERSEAWKAANTVYENSRAMRIQRENEYTAAKQTADAAALESEQQMVELQNELREKTDEIMAARIEKFQGYTSAIEDFAYSMGEAAWSEVDDRKAAAKQLLKTSMQLTKDIIMDQMKQLIMKRAIKQSETALEQAQSQSETAIHAQQVSTDLSLSAAKVGADTASGISSGGAKTIGRLGWWGIPLLAVIGATLSALMGLAMAKINKAKDEVQKIAPSAGRMATGMLTYATGNVDEVTGGTAKKGQSYNVDGADGNTYRARYEGAGMKTGVYRGGAHFGIFSEKQPELIVDGRTTQRLMLNYPGIIDAIQTLSRGGSLTRRGRGGMPTFASGNVDEVLEGMDTDTGRVEKTLSMQTELANLREVVGQLSRTLAAGIKAQTTISILGTDGLDEQWAKAQRYKKRNGLS